MRKARISSRARIVGWPGTFAALFARHTGHRPSAYRAAFHRADRSLAPKDDD
ncbi:hypothetical protein ACFUJR_33950 [Streptomyces sp. NPDC057271]|uniref:hypothetical protein n=1 Tax=unclassified Streptomyces TaxID=2593676 RepID=UPI0036451C2C